MSIVFLITQKYKKKNNENKHIVTINNIYNMIHLIHYTNILVYRSSVCLCSNIMCLIGIKYTNIKVSITPLHEVGAPVTLTQ